MVIKSKNNNNSFPYHSLESAPVLVLILVISHRLAAQESHQHTIEDRGFVLTQLVSVSIMTLSKLSHLIILVIEIHCMMHNIYAGQMSLISTCDQTVSSDSTRVEESMTTNGVKEITDLTADGPVENGVLTSTEASVTQVEQVAENSDIGSYGPEDAPAAESLISRPHAQTFLDKMQNLAFDSGYVHS